MAPFQEIKTPREAGGFRLIFPNKLNQSKTNLKNIKVTHWWLLTMPYHSRHHWCGIRNKVLLLTEWVNFRVFCS